MSAKYEVQNLAEDVGRALDEQGATAKTVHLIGTLAQRAAREGDLLATASGIVHRDARGRFVVMIARFEPNHSTPIHSHEGWGALCLIAGGDHYRGWRREDDGSGLSPVTLELVQDQYLQAGDLACWFDPPYNVHSQAANEKGCVEVIVLKGDGRRLRHFDLEEDASEPAPPRE